MSEGAMPFSLPLGLALERIEIEEGLEAVSILSIHHEYKCQVLPEHISINLEKLLHGTLSAALLQVCQVALAQLLLDRR